MLHFSMGHGGKVFPIHTFFLKRKHVHDHTLTPISLTHLPNASGVTQNK